MKTRIMNLKTPRQTLSALVALTVSLVFLARQANAGTVTNFDASFNACPSGALSSTAVTAASALDAGTATGTWSFSGTTGYGAVSAASGGDKAAAFAHNANGISGMAVMPENGVNVGSTFPVTVTEDAPGPNSVALYANFAGAGGFTGTNTTSINFDWGSYGLNSNANIKYAFVRGLDAFGNEVFELLWFQASTSGEVEILARSATDTNTTFPAANQMPQIDGTVIATNFNVSAPNSTSPSSAPSGMIPVSILLTNSQVTYTIAGGTPSTFALNSGATNISKLEFCEVWNKSSVDTQNEGFWLDNVSAVSVTGASQDAWTGASGTSWTTAGNWSPSAVPAPGDYIHFNSASTANLSTVLGADFSIQSLTLTTPGGPVSIGGGNTLTVESGGIDMSGANQNLTVTAPLVLGVNQIWNVTNNQMLAANGGVSGSSALTLTGGGTVSLGGAASYTGDTTVNTGTTLQMGALNVLPSGSGAGNLNVNGMLDLNGNSESINGLAGGGVVDNTAAGAATITVGNNNAAGTFNGVIQNSGGALALVKTGSGYLTLTSSNSYSGGTTINSSYVYPKDNSNFGSGPVTLNAGTIYAVGGNYVFNNAVTLNGGTLELGGGSGKTLTWSGPVTLTGDASLVADGGTSGLTVSGNLDMGSGGYTLTSSAGSGAANTLITGSITGTTGTIEVTAGTLKLNGTNTFGGILRAVGGSLSVNNIYAAQNATVDYNAADSGGVNYNSLNCILGALSGSRSFAFGPVLSIGNNGSSTTYSGAMSGGGSIIKIGTGTWTLTGTNTYAGNTTINGGTLALSGTGSLASPVITVAGGATLDVSALSSAFVLGTGQTLSNSTSMAILNGDIDASAGAVLLTYAAGTPAMTTAGGALTLATGTTFTVDNTGSALPAGVYPIISSTGGTVGGTLPTVTVTDGGVAAGATAFLQLNGSELDLVVDHAPVAGSSFTMGCVSGQSNTVAIVGGKYSPTDVDSGDTLTITSVTGAANGTVTTDGTNVTYTAASGTSDSFTYTVSDSYGLTATQTVNVTITSSQGYNQLGNPQMIGGEAVMTFYGIPGYKYALEWATTLTPPNWTTVMTNTAAANGLLMLTNPTPGGTDFYRTRYVP